MRKLIAKKEKYFYAKGNVKVPIIVHFEIRSSIRLSLGRRKANLRLPVHLRYSRAVKEVEKAMLWIDQKLSEHPHLAQAFEEKYYTQGDLINVGSRSYILNILYREAKSISAKIKGNLIYLRLNKNTSFQEIKSLLSRVIGKDFKEEIESKLRMLNKLYFHKEIKQVRLKYNQSNWGSCSSSGNINISTRLLFAPEQVIEYVLVHELTHLIEMNHSSRFYQIVASILPNYKVQELWLKENGHLCDF